MTVEQQAMTFAVMALCGVGTGAAHDLLGPFRRNVLTAAAADGILGMICAASVIAAALYLRCEAFRLYTLLGVAAGWGIYAATLGAGLRVLQRILRNLSKKGIN